MANPALRECDTRQAFHRRKFIREQIVSSRVSRMPKGSSQSVFRNARILRYFCFREGPTVPTSNRCSLALVEHDEHRRFAAEALDQLEPVFGVRVLIPLAAAQDDEVHRPFGQEELVRGVHDFLPAEVPDVGPHRLAVDLDRPLRDLNPFRLRRMRDRTCRVPVARPAMFSPLRPDPGGSASPRSRVSCRREDGSNKLRISEGMSGKLHLPSDFVGSEYLSKQRHHTLAPGFLEGFQVCHSHARKSDPLTAFEQDVSRERVSASGPLPERSQHPQAEVARSSHCSEHSRTVAGRDVKPLLPRVGSATARSCPSDSTASDRQAVAGRGPASAGTAARVGPERLDGSDVRPLLPERSRCICNCARLPERLDGRRQSVYRRGPVRLQWLRELPAERLGATTSEPLRLRSRYSNRVS